MGRLLGLGAAALGLALVTACGYTPSALESWPKTPSCGRYENLNEPVPADQRRKNRCLLDALSEGRRAELFVTYATVEGDPITTYYRVLGPRRLEVFIDSTRDSFGSREWTHMLCDGVVEESGFVFADSAGCRELSVDEVVS